MLKTSPVQKHKGEPGSVGPWQDSTNTSTSDQRRKPPRSAVPKRSVDTLRGGQDARQNGAATLALWRACRRMAYLRNGGAVGGRPKGEPICAATSDASVRSLLRAF